MNRKGSRVEWFKNTLVSCVEGVFLAQWKRQNLVLLPKLQTSPGVPSSYGPICFLGTTYGEYIAELQYGYRRARSMVDAIAVVGGNFC